MVFFELIVLVLIAPFLAYRLVNIYYKRLLTNRLNVISGAYGINAHDVDFFHRKLIAYDKKRSVIVFLDNERGEEDGHLIGTDEIIQCELVVHETNEKASSHNIDRIDLELKLKTNNKQVTLPLYEKNMVASLNQNKLQLKAIDWYEKLNAFTLVNVEAVGQIA